MWGRAAFRGACFLHYAIRSAGIFAFQLYRDHVPYQPNRFSLTWGENVGDIIRDLRHKVSFFYSLLTHATFLLCQGFSYHPRSSLRLARLKEELGNVPLCTQLPSIDILGNSEAENLLVVLRAVGHGGTFK